MPGSLPRSSGVDTVTTRAPGARGRPATCAETGVESCARPRKNAPIAAGSGNRGNWIFDVEGKWILLLLERQHLFLRLATADQHRCDLKPLSAGVQRPAIGLVQWLATDARLRRDDEHGPVPRAGQVEIDRCASRRHRVLGR